LSHLEAGTSYHKLPRRSTFHRGPEFLDRLSPPAASDSAVFTHLAGLEATYHKALITRIDTDSDTAQTAGSPAAKITTNITGANGKLTTARNRTKGR
jgi:hypothetical protein